MKTILLLLSISPFLLEKANSRADLSEIKYAKFALRYPSADDVSNAFIYARGSSKRTDCGNGPEAFPVGPYKYRPSYPRHRRPDKQNRRIPDRQALDIPARWIVETDHSITAPNKHDPQYPYRPSPWLPHKSNLPYPRRDIFVIPERSSPGSGPPCGEKPKKSPRSGSRDRSHSVIPDTGSVPRYLGSCECGISDVPIINITGDIHIGVQPPFQYPWMVAIQGRDELAFCGGAILSDQYILTSANCLAKGTKGFVNNSEIRVAFTTNTTLSSGVNVTNIIAHPKYRYLNIDHNIALIKLKDRIQCSHQRRPICLPTHRMQVHTGQQFIIAGWGSRKGGNPHSFPPLKEALMELVDISRCSGMHGKVKKDFHCLQGVNMSNPCHGDSGGPMFSEYQDRFYVFGVAFVPKYQSCRPKDNLVYTKVTNYLDWINSEMRQ